MYPFYILICNGLLQNSGAVYDIGSCLLYHLYIITMNYVVGLSYVTYLLQMKEAGGRSNNSGKDNSKYSNSSSIIFFRSYDRSSSERSSSSSSSGNI